jgi:DNA polymerase I-like protein with 3'-5' exonuclease and polymerase domains
MPDKKQRRLLWDVETDGLLPTMTRIHCLLMQDVDTDEMFKFRRNDEEDTIAEGVEMLQNASMLIGHNIIGFDIKAVKKVFPEFDPVDAEIRDTLVLVRLLPIDFKPLDIAANKSGRLPGKFMGKHSLDSWGYRLGKRKGDYAKEMLAQGMDPWFAWNQEMEDYCENDVIVNRLLWDMIQKYSVPEDVVDMEQACQEVVTYMEHTGFFFDKAEAEKLHQKLQSTMDETVARLVADRCGAFVPEKKYVIKPLWDDPFGMQKAKKYGKPRPEFGEDGSRKWWADVSVPKKTMKSRDPKKRGDRTEGAPYCKIKWKDFNPASRIQVTDLLVEEYNWTPTDWTKTGMPSVDDIVLRSLGETIPLCNDLADVFFLQKLLGYIANGSEAWLKKYNEETGAVHCYINIGGTVTGRCAHQGPNLGQVPSVIVGPDKQPLLGLAGRYGYECRSLFSAPREVRGIPWKQVGVDLSGIEFRCLAEAMAPHDGGETIKIITSGQDIHKANMEKTGITSRDVIKRGLYGLLYGAGDQKLGSTVAPDRDSSQWQEIGRRFRAQLMDGIPALKEVIKETQAQAKHGFLTGLDGRKIACRSPHSALNTRLQSAAALIAKRWLIFTEDMMMDEGFDHGLSGDFALLAFVHDEIQAGVKAEYAEKYAAICIEAAAEAGRSFEFLCPIDAEAKIGTNWAETH